MKHLLLKILQNTLKLQPKKVTFYHFILKYLHCGLAPGGVVIDIFAFGLRPRIERFCFNITQRKLVSNQTTFIRMLFSGPNSTEK